MEKSQKTILVILPGWGGSQQTWADFVALAKPHFADVVVIDLPCFGSEPCPTEVWGVGEYADFVKLKMKEQRSKNKMVLLGHSFGGQVATYLTAKNPEICDKLILVGAAVVREKSIAKKIVIFLVKIVNEIFTLFSGPDKQFLRKLFYRWNGNPEYGEASGIQKKIYQKIIAEDQQALLPRIQIPTLLVWGDRDRQTLLSHGKKIASQLPNATLEIIPDGRHGLHHKQHAQKLLDIIARWLFL